VEKGRESGVTPGILHTCALELKGLLKGRGVGGKVGERHVGIERERL
jgi:hypothetical protein